MKPGIPASVTVECPDCGSEELHKTIKGRHEGRAMKLVLRCCACGRVREEVLVPVRAAQVRMIVSRGDDSKRMVAEFPEDWDFTVGDDFMHGEERLLVTGIEAGGARVDAANVSEIQTLWTKNFDETRVRISMNRRGRTRSLEILTSPEEEFTVGSEIEVDNMQVLVHSIKTSERHLRRGSAQARDIVRIYCRDAGRRFSSE